MRPPYVNPENGDVYQTDNPTITGYLTKQSAWLKEWRERFFLLQGSKLFFAKNEHDAPHGMIDLSQCNTVKSAELKVGKKFAIQVTTKESTFYMIARNEKEKDEWIGSIGRAIVQASDMFTKDDNEDGGSSSEED